MLAHRSGGAIRVSTAIRFSAGCFRTRGKGISPTSCSTTWWISIPNTCAIARSSRRYLTDTQRRRKCGLPISPRAFANSNGSFGRRNSIASSNRSPACRASPFGCGRPANTASRCRTVRSAAIISAITNDSTVIRLTTDAPLSLIDGEAPFVLTRPLHLVFGPDEPFAGDLQKTCRDFVERTHDYWMEWVRRLSISYDWQEAIIRAAITLKLSNFDETGGIIAAHTTSIPEAPSSGRTWDYRYCWLRDAYFVVQALNRIGATRTMEEFISFTLSIASKPDQELRPLYSVVPTTDDRGADRAGPCRLSRRRPGAHRQCRGRPGAERHLWQRHSRRHADVLRPPAAAAGRRRPVSSARIARQPRGQKGVRARRRHLGISRAPARPHPFGGDVLGRLPAARGDRGAARPRRARQTLERDRRADARRAHRARLERQSAAPSPPRSAPTISTPACCCSPTSASSKSTIRALSPPSPPWSANWCAKSTSCAMPAPTISACR